MLLWNLIGSEWDTIFVMTMLISLKVREIISAERIKLNDK